MTRREVTIQNAVGLHARPATFFIQKANTYKCSIWVEKDERKVNAKSLLGVLSLGIVQGMSGSPIIQDGKLVGAVTHVLINDPTMGYGIFIENMLTAINLPVARAS